MVVYGKNGLSRREQAYELLAQGVRLTWGLDPLPEIRRAEEGKPYFTQNPGLEFNLSHSSSLALCALLRTIDSFRLFDKVNLLTGGGPDNSTSTITQYLYNYGIKSLDFGFGSAGAIVMTVLVLLLSSVYIKRAIS